MKFTKKHYLMATAVMGITSLEMTEYAMSADNGLFLEEVVVTARKRAESARDIPIAVTALTARFLEDSRINQMADIYQYIPNVDYDDQQADSLTGSISIRGVVRNTDVEEPGYGLYKDGVYIGSPVAGLDQFNDLERVEVLKGPQGGLYGRNAIGGAINIVSKKPVDQLEGTVDVSIANFDRQEYRGMVNIPIEDNFYMRLNVYHINQDKGKAKSAVTGVELDRVDATGARVSTQYIASETLSISLNFEYQESTSPAAIIINGPVLGDSVPPGDDESALNISGTHEVAQDAWHAYTQIDWDTAIGTVTTLLSYRDLNVDSQTGFAPFVGAGGAVRQSEQHNWFIETRLASSVSDSDLDYVFGMNYLNEDYNFYRVLNLPIGVAPVGFDPGTGPAFANLGLQSPMTTISTKMQSWAAFGELTYHVTPRLEVTASGRFTHEKKTHDNFVETPSADAYLNTGADIGVPEIGFPGFGFTSPPWSVDFQTKDSWTNFSPTVSMAFKPNDDWMLYAKVATGFKAGGYNNEASAVELLPFDQEKAITYEIGAKGSAWDNRLQMNFAGFRIDRRNASIFILDDNPIFQLLGVSIVGNGGETTTKGFEADFTVAPFQGMVFYGAVGYLDAKFDNGYLKPNGDDFSGNVIPQTSKWSMSMVATYRVPVSDEINIFSQATYSNKWGGFERDDNLIELDHPELINVKLGLESESWSVTGYINNLLDDRNKYFQRGNPGLGLRQFILGKSRTYGVSLKYNF